MCEKCSHGVQLVKAGIWQAIDDYRRHTSQTAVLDDISEEFVARLASDSFKMKAGLCEMFRKSPAWDEEIQALVINGMRTHNPDYIQIHDLANQILVMAKVRADSETQAQIQRAIRFFSCPDENPEIGIAAIKSLAPKAYAPNKKPSRIFKALCDALGVTDNTAGSEFQKLFAQFADELTARKIDFKLFASINPAHFLTMSNPKDDERGEMLTSCHSFNRTDYTYNCGCTGYARDQYTFIVFTVADPDNPELLNNRKTTRQLFMYKPNNGLLLQSRLYNTYGGTSGEQEESKLYRDLIQREISEIEDAPNLWKTSKYYGNDEVQLPAAYGFGGYTDWTYPSFNAKVSIRTDHREDFQPFEIGAFGLCVKCGADISEGLYCSKCQPDDSECCDDCGEPCDERWAVHDRYGNIIHVCERCLSDYYCCEHCDEYFSADDVTSIDNGTCVCTDCLDVFYSLCDCCDEYFPTEFMYTSVDSHGNESCICEYCRDHYYIECDECGRYVHNDDAWEVHNSEGESITICRSCIEDACYENCSICGELYHEDAMTDGVCINCRRANEAGENE